jgi:hypothetical protein
VIFTGDYGEAGAINELGRGTGLPAAVSGQNSEWWWGPGNPRATTVVAVMPGPRRYHQRRGFGLPHAVFHQRAGGGHPVESGRPPQPGMGRPRLYLHRPSAPVGPQFGLFGAGA